MSIPVAGVRLNPYLIGSLYPAPDACPPLRIHQSSRMVGPPIFVSSILLVTSCGCRSPSGKLVLTKLTRSIKVWTEVCPTSHSSLRPRTFPASRKACVAKQSTDIALCSPSAGCQVVKVSLRCSRRRTLLTVSRALAFMSVEGGDVTKLVSSTPFTHLLFLTRS